MDKIGLGVTIVSLSAWLGLLGLRGQFWRLNQQLEQDASISTSYSPLPTICAVVPARNEADLLPVTLRSLLAQNYPGPFTIILVDDNSSDDTTQVAKQMAEEMEQSRLFTIASESLPAGWTGKLWAIDRGIQAAQQFAPDYILLTDADIQHDVANLYRLVTKAEQQNFDLVSVMVRLRCESFWEQLLIPAFVFFFQKLYPFRWVNDAAKPTAAAAGGCILIRRTALDRIGGIQSIRQALIDDCALAYAIKVGGKEGTREAQLIPHAPYHKIWLGLSSLTHSLRPYPSLATIWNMVARTAYTQLNYSPWLLLGALFGMTLIYLVPPIGAFLGILTKNWAIVLTGLAGWLLMTLAYFPTVRFYSCSPIFACCLPAIASLYIMMTFDSALRHWQGRGGAWKGRVYEL